MCIDRMVFGATELEPKRFREWQQRYLEASASPGEKAKRAAGQPNAIDRLEGEIETNLTLQAGRNARDATTRRSDWLIPLCVDLIG